MSKDNDQRNVGGLIGEGSSRFWADLFLEVPFPHDSLADWLKDAIHFAEAISESTSGTKEANALFWIRLYGVLHDGALAAAEVAESNKVTFEEFGDPNFRTLAEMMQEASDVIAELRNALSQDEQIYIQFRRATESHPFQDYLRLTRRKDGRYQGDRTLLGRQISVEDLKRALRRIHEQYGDDEATLARGIAAKALPFLRRLHDIVEEYEFLVGPAE